jgi:hypothetical protein
MKEHSCCLCGEVIPDGEKHTRRIGIMSDGPRTFRLHVKCESGTKDWDLASWKYFCGFDQEFLEWHEPSIDINAGNPE